jgi:alpha-N-arabinofuranosidase
MFSRNLGDEILATTSVNTPVQGCATRDRRTGEIFVKLVNPATNAVALDVEISGVTSLASKGTAITLAGNPGDSNSITQPKQVVLVTKTIRGLKPGFTYTLPPNSIVVLKLKTRS